MSGQYFEVGEEVVVSSVRFPQLNGGATILEIKPPSIVSRHNPHCSDGLRIPPTNQIIYWLSVSVASFECAGWAEQPALRKKHKPSDESFSELMVNYEAGKVSP